MNLYSYDDFINDKDFLINTIDSFFRKKRFNLLDCKLQKLNQSFQCSRFPQVIVRLDLTSAFRRALKSFRMQDFQQFFTLLGSLILQVRLCLDYEQFRLIQLIPMKYISFILTCRTSVDTFPKLHFLDLEVPATFVAIFTVEVNFQGFDCQFGVNPILTSG